MEFNICIIFATILIEVFLFWIHTERDLGQGLRDKPISHSKPPHNVQRYLGRI